VDRFAALAMTAGGAPTEQRGMTIDRRAVARDQFLAALRQSPVLMGILNVTPDSFSDGGRHFDPGSAVARAKGMVAEGAAIVDIGGESTRPGHAPVSAEEELWRVKPVLEALVADFDVAVSIDTGKAAVAREAARLGASVINDVWGLQRDPGMADAVADTGSALVIMHNRERADGTIDILDDVERFFERSLNLAAGAGVPFSRILLDPGVGFGKTPEQNHSCIWNLDRFPPLRRGRSSSGFRANRSSAGSPAPRSTTVSPARLLPTRLRSCGELRCSGCMTWPRTAPRWTSSRR
jgi:dihydropteroate synthase